MADDRQDERALRGLRQRLAEEVLSADYPVEDIDDELRADGADPRRVGRRFSTLVKNKLDEHRRLAWRDRARANMDRVARVLAKVPSEPAPRNKAEALAMLSRLRTDARAGGLVSAAFRKKSPTESTEEEILALVDDVRKFLAISDDDADTK